MQILKIFDYFFVLRPMLHLPVWTILILGYYSHGYSHGNKWHLLLSLLVGTGLAGTAYLVNQIFDIESDRINDKLHFLPKGYIKIRTAWIMTFVLSLVSLAAAFYISQAAGIVAVLIFGLGLVYSSPPLAIKNRAWQAALTNGIGYGGLVFILGYCAAGGLFLPAIFKSLPYFFAVAGVYIGTTLPDIEGDKKTGKLTIGVIFGSRKTAILILACYGLSIISGFILRDTPFLFAALAAMPFYIWSVIAKNIKSTILAIKVSILTLTLAAGYFFPLYLIFIVLLILATRIYYKSRFELTYPSLK
jgi:4-hydroxybenzoate polyprenyltransferase